MAFFPKSRAFLRDHLLLLVIGVISECCYLFFFVRQFPLLQYYHGLIDMAQITGHSHAGFAQFVLVYSVLFVVFGLAWWEARRFQRRATLWLILSFGALFGLTMSFVYPGTAIDIFVYIAQSVALVQYHVNPIVTAPANVANDPLITLGGGWSYFGAPYGPLGLVIDAIPTIIFGRNLLAMLLMLKLMFSAMIVVEGWLAYKILSFYAPKFALAGAVFVAWNPFFFFEYSANAHNDIVMMLFVMLASLALVDKRFVLAMVLLVTSALVKYAMLPIIPLFFLYSLVHQPNMKRRMIYLGLALLCSLLVVLVIYGPFWQGIKTLSPLLYQDTRYMSSLSTMLTDVSSGQVTNDQAKLVGRILFALIYIYALFLSTRSLEKLFQACFLTIFFFLALVLTNFEIWYGIWPALLAILYPHRSTHIAVIAFLYGTALSVTTYYYLWVWLGLTVPYLALVNDLAYLMAFVPALLLLLAAALQKWFSPAKSFDDRNLDRTPLSDETPVALSTKSVPILDM